MELDVLHEALVDDGQYEFSHGLKKANVMHLARFWFWFW